MSLLKQITLIFLFSALISFAANSQIMRNFTIGIKSGTNFTIVNTSVKHSIFENSESANSSIFEKEYGSFIKNVGSQYAFLVYYTFNNNIEFTFQPGLFNYNYKYKNEYNWTGTQDYSVIYNFKHNIRYIDLPLGIKYNLNWKKYNPYFHAGFYYGLKENSTKYITKTESSSLGEYKFEKEALGADKTVITSNIGIFAGGGVEYKFEHSKIGIEVNFRYGFNTVTKKDFRYKSNTMAGKYYDVPDDVRLLNISIGILYAISLKCVKKYPLPQYRNY